jgi:hypothetical protein
MPSLLHESIVLLFRNQPELATELLRQTKLLEVPPFSSARIESIDFSEIVPAEYRVDLVIVLKQNGKAVYCVIVEVQLARKKRKRETWPFYQASARARFRCPTALLVVTPDDSIARWAARPFHIGGGYFWAPLVLGPQGIPVVENPDLARQYPELGVLSVMAHGRGEPARAARIAQTTAQALVSLSYEDRMLYSDIIDSHLGDAARKALTMIPEGYQFQSRFGNQRFAEGKALALLAVLDARGLTVTVDERKRIVACTDLDPLERWIRQAVTVATVGELFV